jgi:hypothetical protein
MAQSQLSDLDFGGIARVLNLLDAVSPQEPATLAQLRSAIEGIAWKDSVRVDATTNITIASPGATINGVTMVANDRVLPRAQTAQSENGIYIWNGPSTPMTRALDASTSDELEGATVTVEEGPNAGSTFRQTQVNFTLGSGNVVWAPFGTSAPSASETTAGVAEIATQVETDTGADDLRIVTPLKLATWSGRKLKFSQSVGDGSATSILVTHNLNTRDVQVQVYRNSGNFDTVNVEVQRTSVNSVTLIFAAAPAANAHRVVIVG